MTGIIYIKDEDINFCSPKFAFYNGYGHRHFFSTYQSWKSYKVFNESHVRSGAFGRSCLITLCITFYSMLLLLSCTNYELRPRFLQGFSILIFGLVLSGSFMAIPCVVALIFLGNKNEAKRFVDAS